MVLAIAFTGSPHHSCKRRTRALSLSHCPQELGCSGSMVALCWMSPAPFSACHHCRRSSWAITPAPLWWTAWGAPMDAHYVRCSSSALLNGCVLFTVLNPRIPLPFYGCLVFFTHSTIQRATAVRSSGAKNVCIATMRTQSAAHAAIAHYPPAYVRQRSDGEPA